VGPMGDIRGKKVLVTGGAGFIGSHLVERLMQKSLAVTVLDNMSTGTLANVSQHIGRKNFRLEKGDVRNVQRLREEIKRSDIVFHLAALVDIQRSVRSPLLTNEINVFGTLNLLESCRNADIDLLVYASSCAVYGDAGEGKICERVPPRPISPYAASKLAAENYCLAFHRTYGLPVICLRFFNVYGPRQKVGPYAGVVVKFVQKLFRNQPPIIYGDGKQSRDFVSIRDAVRACELSLERRKAIGQTVNIGSGRSTTINDVAGLLVNLTHRTHIKPIYRPAREGEIRHSLADISLARKALGYRPTVSLRKGLLEYLEWTATQPQSRMGRRGRAK